MIPSPQLAPPAPPARGRAPSTNAPTPRAAAPLTPPQLRVLAPRGWRRVGRGRGGRGPLPKRARPLPAAAAVGRGRARTLRQVQGAGGGGMGVAPPSMLHERAAQGAGARPAQAVTTPCLPRARRTAASGGSCTSQRRRLWTRAPRWQRSLAPACPYGSWARAWRHSLMCCDAEAPARQPAALRRGSRAAWLLPLAPSLCSTLVQAPPTSMHCPRAAAVNAAAPAAAHCCHAFPMLSRSWA